MSNQPDYTSSIRQAQESWSGAAQSLAENLQKAFTPPSATAFPTVDPNQAIDQIFDFWEKTLQAQRDFAKQLAGVSVSVSERVREQAENAGQSVRDQAESTTQVIRDQAESSKRAARDQAESSKRAAREQAASQQRAEHEQAAERYQDMTKAQLQEELASRDLPKTGNVDELRERLIAEDQK